MPYGPGNPGRPPGQFDFDIVTPQPPIRYPNLFPPGENIEGLQEEIGDLDLDYEDPGDWWRDVFDVPGDDPFGAPQTPGGPGNPIDYDAPWNVGAYPSWPGYQPPGPPYQRPPLVPPGFPTPIPTFPSVPGLRPVPPRFDKPGVIPPDPDNPGFSGGTPSLVPGAQFSVPPGGAGQTYQRPPFDIYGPGNRPPNLIDTAYPGHPSTQNPPLPGATFRGGPYVPGPGHPLYPQPQDPHGPGGIPGFAQGGDFLTNGPQMIMVGDNPGGVERVQVDPMNYQPDVDPDFDPFPPDYIDPTDPANNPWIPPRPPILQGQRPPDPRVADYPISGPNITAPFPGGIQDPPQRPGAKGANMIRNIILRRLFGRNKKAPAWPPPLVNDTIQPMF